MKNCIMQLAHDNKPTQISYGTEYKMQVEFVEKYATMLPASAWSCICIFAN